MKKLYFIILILSTLIFTCADSADKPGTLTFWHFWTNPDVKPTVEKIIKSFEETETEVDVNIGDLTWSDGHEKIVIALSSGKGPDVVELGSDWIAELAMTGKLKDLSNFTFGFKKNLKMWEPATFKGKVYAFPWLLGTRVLFCNRTLLKQAGYKDNWAPQDWNDLYVAARKINLLGDDVYGFGSNSAERHRLYKKFLPFFWSAGGQIFSINKKKTQFASSAGIQSMEYYYKLSQQGIIESQSRLDDYFAAGKIGFVISGEWLVHKLADKELDFEPFVTVFPAPKKWEMGTSFAGGEYLAVRADTPDSMAAIRLIHHLCNPENNTAFCQATGNFTPANVRSRLDLTDDMRDVGNVFKQQLIYSRSTPQHPAWVYIEEILEKGIEQVIYDKQSVNDALKWIDEECLKILERHAEK